MRRAKRYRTSLCRPYASWNSASVIFYMLVPFEEGKRFGSAKRKSEAAEKSERGFVCARTSGQGLSNLGVEKKAGLPENEPAPGRMSRSGTPLQSGSLRNCR